MTAADLGRYGIGALAFVTMAVCGYLLDAIRTPEDRTSKAIAWVCMLVAGIGLVAIIVRLLLIGLAA